jgi:hypothetical protein
MAPITRSTRSATRKKFSSLPDELRRMVWEATIVPRILHITVETIKLPPLEPPTGRRRKSSPPHNHVRFRAVEKCPATLHVCHESRTVALKHYTPSFHSSTYPQSRASSQKQTAIYFNPKLDVVHIEDKYHDRVRQLLSCRTDEETTRSIRVLVIEGSVTVPQEAEADFPTLYPQIWHDLPLFKGLEDIIWVFDDEETKKKADAIRDGIERHMNMFKDSLQARGEVWRVPAIKVMDPKTFGGEWP